MKFAIHVVLFITLYCCANAQNLLPNPGFEQYVTCPTAINQLNTSCSAWSRYTTGTPDYFNACATATVGVPGNFVGNEPAATGNGYIGIITRSTSAQAEYVKASIAPLRVGGKYLATAKVSLSDFSTQATGNFGMYFFKSAASFINNSAVVNVVPQASFSSAGIITGKTGWTKLTTRFTADSAYTGAVFGAFYNPATASFTTLSTGIISAAYYYVDDVELKLDMRTVMSFTDSVFCTGDSISAAFTVDSSTYFASGNVFSLQLSDSSGSFAAPVVLGSYTSTTSGMIKGVIPANVSTGNGYRVRITANTPSDTSLDNGYGIKIFKTPGKPVATANTPLCSIDTLKLNATSSSTSVNWSWTGPGNFSAAISNPKRSLLQAIHSGQYIVTASVAHCHTKDTISVTVNMSPDPVSIGGNPVICQGDSLKLYVSTPAAGVSYSWTGPSGFSATRQNITLANAQPSSSGKYYLSAKLNGCSTGDSTMVQVKPMPYVTISNNSGICAGNTLNLSASAPLAGVSYSWSGPVSFLSVLQHPSIQNAGPQHSGIYTVSARLNGCTATDTSVVVVHPLPNVPSVTGNNPICVNDTLKLHAIGTIGASYFWSGPKAFRSALQSPQLANIALSDSGKYKIKVTTNKGCIRTDSIYVHVKPLPVTTVSNTSPVCAGGTFKLNAVCNTSGAVFTWTGPNGYSANVKNPPMLTQVQPAQTGSYTITATHNGCSFTASTHATVHATPVAKTSSNMPVCGGENVELRGNLVNGASYKWTGPNGFSSGLRCPVFNNGTPLLNGVYVLKLTANNCISKPDTVLLTVNPKPAIGAYASPGDTICSGTVPTFVAFIQHGGARSSFQWYRNYQPLPGGNQLIQVVPDIRNRDVLFCVFNAEDVCNSTQPIYSDTIKMTVLPIVTRPVVKIFADSDLGARQGKKFLFTADVTHGGTRPRFQWYKNGQELIGAVYATLAISDLSIGDKIMVSVISEDPCAENKTASDAVMISAPAGVNNLEEKEQVMLYPNPGSGDFTVSVVNGDGISIEIMNTLGQVVFKQAAVNTDKIFVRSNLLPGAYVVRVSTRSKKWALPYIVQ